MTCINQPSVEAFDALVKLAVDCRPTDAPKWHPQGIKAAIRNVCADQSRRFTFAELVINVVQSAMRTDARTPAVIEHEASWVGIKPPVGADRIYSWTEGDPRTICGICDMKREACESRAKTNGHGFIPRTDCLPPRTVENAWMRRRPEGQEPLCGAGPINAQPCGLLLGHAGEHEVNDERQVR